MDAATNQALIGAASALAGVALSQLVSMLQSFLERRQQRTALLRSKLEEIAYNLHQTNHWADSFLNMVTGSFPRSSKPESHPPVALSAEARQVYVLSLLYFPALREESRKLLNSLNTLYAYGTGDKDIGEQGFKQAAIHFGEAKRALDDLISKEARGLC